MVEGGKKEGEGGERREKEMSGKRGQRGGEVIRKE